MKKNMFLLIALSAFSFSLVEAFTINKPPCRSEEACVNDPNCECYCSVKCGYRKKELEKGDRPVFKDGVCWCKEWDYQNYRKRHCDLKEQAGGQAPTLPAVQQPPAVSLPTQNLLDY
ncbi:hypothetical protein HYX58_02640 [Candidatus Dependentiae bacterium]|nr:hypothetical protein [Candidatus Dependentiae bacterium]